MIIRIWHGYTAPENAIAYEQLLMEQVFPTIAARNIPGYRGIQLLKKTHEEAMEFITIMSFDNWEGVKVFAGEDYEKSYVIDEAKFLLSRYDTHARHYELRYNTVS